MEKSKRINEINVDLRLHIINCNPGLKKFCVMVLIAVDIFLLMIQICHIVKSTKVYNANLLVDNNYT